MNWSSYIVLTEPIPDRLAELGWTGGEGLCDARFTLHYLRTTPDGRIALGGGGGRAGWGGRVGTAFTARRGLGATGRGRPAPTVPEPGRRPDRGRLGRPDRHLRRPPAVLRDPARRPAPLRPRLQRQRRRAGPSRRPDPRGAGARSGDDPVLELPIVGRRPRRFPPEPFRSVGARVVREAIVRRERGRGGGPAA